VSAVDARLQRLAGELPRPDVRGIVPVAGEHLLNADDYAYSSNIRARRLCWCRVRCCRR